MKAMQDAVLSFAEARGWRRFHSPRNVAEAIVAEAAELLEIFQWRSEQESALENLSQEDRRAIESELADILIYCLNLANTLGADASEVIQRKLRENEVRFPVDSQRTGPWRP